MKVTFTVDTIFFSSDIGESAKYHQSLIGLKCGAKKLFI